MATPQWALEIIKEEKRTGSKFLNLDGRDREVPLKQFPIEILELVDLEVLDLSLNRLLELPKSIQRLKNLRRLELLGNNLRALPSELIKMPNLRELNIGYNNFSTPPEFLAKRTDWITLGLSHIPFGSVPGWLALQTELRDLSLIDSGLASLPDWLGNLQFISDLWIGDNAFQGFPEVITELSNLQVLSLDSCGLSELPSSIGNLQQLFWCSLDGNNISELPERLAALQNLQTLSLMANKFDQIPLSIYGLKNLEDLSLGGNAIKEIPRDILRLTKLETLQMEGNPIESPPLEVVQQGIDAIREYYRQTEDEGVDHLYEAKLLIVGEPGAGKTTLTRKLKKPSYRLDENEKSTEGIDITRWSFPYGNGKQFQVNVWDFGGQEIYHATHQFFLTKRSLYLLVADTRKEDTDFEYWLNAVELLSDGSPLLIIKNEKQDRQRALDETALRGRFAGLKETLAANLANNRGLAQIKEAIRHYIRSLPHVGAALPKTWVQVRAALEKDPRNFISQDEYLTICQQNGFANRADALQLSGYLHDLGVCLHFQEDAILRHIVILKPQWGTDAVYKVLDNPGVIERQGEFSITDLQEIWSQPEYSGMHYELIQLMINFRLAYKIPHAKDGYIAPQLLGLERPAYVWDERENLHLRYVYSFMPKGLITQLIVALHEQIADQNLVWRNGVVLQDRRGKTRAEVVQDYSRRQIHIRVSGAQKKELLTIVGYEMEEIHAAYSRLKFDTLIPCNCDKCKSAPNPHFFKLETLDHFIENRQSTIQCQSSFSMVDVRGLVDDIFPPPQPDERTGRIPARYEQHFHAPVTLTQDNREVHASTVIEGGVEIDHGDFVGENKITYTFGDVYEQIEQSETIQPADKSSVKEAVEEIEEELHEERGPVRESFLTRRFRNLARMAPDILDVALAAAVSPAAGFTEAARKIAKRAAEQAKAEHP